ncbi:diphthine--ammonia ligase isoform X2 [Syngnathoides biaculeatus]|uniref:diphthine--ammonia ligase isoform X2 n=1 Tax=Syngnathoides biaculeatus TaxID=300417 RepID=UPI002ADD6347|nr:diphthine--ammonia ligase isoform X2 [Syngnathoides biaculeatus]
MKMKVVALISGGKDSCYNMMQCVAAGHHIVALANLRPAHKDELDSYMYQTVGHQAIELFAEAMDLPLYRRTIQGSSLDTSRDYRETEGDEVEDLYQLLRLVKEKEGVDAVSAGAILSDYQRVRVENVCLRLGLHPLAYLWRRDQESLLSEMISSDVHAILIKVAAFGLDPDKHLGKSLADMAPYLKQLSQKYGVHICGEGGEYETLTLDCPLFKKKLVIDASETVIHSADAFAPVGYLRFSAMHAEMKATDAAARDVARARCPCQRAIDKMTEEAKYADGAGDDHRHRRQFTSDADLSCQPGHVLPTDVPPSCSSRTSQGYQWISGIHGLQSQDTGIRAQTAAAFACLQSELDNRGWNMKDIVLVHLYVSSMEDFGPLNTVYQNHFTTSPPARVCVQASLPTGQLLQMDCLLHKRTEPAAEDRFHRREALHVQSLSHWAPANIGPYSQALRVDDAVFCAGQIALVPCTLQLVKAGTRTQAILSFSHTQKVLEAAIGSLTLAHVVQAHCYATRFQDVAVIQAAWESVLEDLLVGPDGNPPPSLVVVVVPALPKSAAVELHVTAIQDDPSQRTSCHMTTTLRHSRIECHVLTSADRSAASLSLRLAVIDPAVTEDAREVTAAICSAFEKALEKTEAELVPLCARVFYKCHHMLAKQVTEGLEDSLKNLLGDSSPSVALVPVLALPGSNILHLSCWLSF